MEIIVPADSAIQSPADIEGKALAFTAPTSNSGFKAPSALLLSEFGLEADKDYKTAFSGKHDNSVIGVSNKDYEAAAVANSVMKRMLDREVVEADSIRTIRSEEHTSELQSLMRSSYAVFCLKKKNKQNNPIRTTHRS